MDITCTKRAVPRDRPEAVNVTEISPWTSGRTQQALTHFQKLMPSQEQAVKIKAAKGRCRPHGGEPRNHKSEECLTA